MEGEKHACKSQGNETGITVCGPFFTALFCLIFPSRYDVFQPNLGRLKKGLARGERLEALNIHRLVHMCILSEPGRGKRKGNFKSLESLFFILPREMALGGPTGIPLNSD